MRRRPHHRPHWVSRAERRRHNQDRLGWALMILVILAYALMFYTAYRIDASNGITPCQSLANWGMHVCR